MKVTPYEVKGKIDYEKLITKFGVKRLTPKLKRKLGDHHLLRRNIFFAHRDLEKLTDNFFLYTGCGPSGNIHLGHYIVWEFTKWLQDQFGCDVYFQFTDDEKFLYKNMSYDDIQHWTKENMLDVAAVGFNPKKTFFIVNTKHANLMYPEAIKVAKKLTLSTVKSAFGFTNETNIGSYFYTAMQTVPTFLPNILDGGKRQCLIPYAIDQDPHFRLTRDIVPKLGHQKPLSIQCKFLPALQGDGKLSSSVGNAIYLTDSPSQVKKKINKYAFSGGRDTVKEHREKGGNPDIDTSFQWLRYFEASDKVLDDIELKYKSGEMLSGELKLILVNKINSILAEHQKRREKVILDQFML